MKEFNIKKFQLEDTFYLSKIIADLDIEIDLNSFMDASKNKKDASYVGGQFFLMLVKKWHLGKKSIPEFMAVISQETADEVKKWDLKTAKNFFIELFKQEGIQDFFKSASEE